MGSDAEVDGGALLADVVLGAAAGAWRLTRWVTGPVRVTTGAVLHGVVAAGRRVRPDLVSALAVDGRRSRADLEHHATEALQWAVRYVVGAVVTTVDLTALVLRHVDLDAIAAGLDLDAAVARVDLDAAVARVDFDAAVARVDLDAAVARVDLDAAVARVDLDAAVARVDLDAVARRLDVAAIVATVDPDPVAARLDIDAVLARVDIVGIVRDTIDAVDLPAIVRKSTGALSSDAVRGVRTEGEAADDVVAGFVDRLLRRRTAPAAVLPGPAPP